MIIKKEMKNFKEKYSSGDIDTEVISNILQPFHQDKHPEIKEYCDFWWPSNKELSGLLSVLQINITIYAANALSEAFGKHDFTFNGNRLYKNYILEFDGLTIIAPDKRAVVLPETKDIREKLISFEKSYCQLVMDYVFKHYDELKDFEKESLEKMKVAGIIDADNKIDFNYVNKPISKIKIK